MLAVPWPGRFELFAAILLLLVNKYPKIRKLNSELLYSRLLACSGIVEEEMLDDALAILMETAWYDFAHFFARRDVVFSDFTASYSVPRAGTAPSLLWRIPWSAYLQLPACHYPLLFLPLWRPLRQLRPLAARAMTRPRAAMTPPTRTWSRLFTINSKNESFSISFLYRIIISTKHI